MRFKVLASELNTDRYAFIFLTKLVYFYNIFEFIL